jgi:putative oxidoreductase
MKTKTLTAARIALGIGFLVFGLDGFLHLIPIPPARPAAARFIGALIETGYLFQLVKAVEVICGLLLLSNRLLPLALTLLAPLLVGITSIHLFLNPEGLPLMFLLTLPYLLLVRGYWPYLRAVLTFQIAATAVAQSSAKSQ